MDQVISVGFEDDSKAYEALTVLRELGSQGQLRLREAEVVVRDDNGHVALKDQTVAHGTGGTTTGGVVGLLVGILAGPFGILIGGITGLFIGSLFDMRDSDETDSVLSEIAQSLRPGRTALLAELQEQSPEVVDTAMAGLGGVVLRRLVDDVEAEIAAAEDAQRAAKKAAGEHLREQRHDQHREKIRATIVELKTRLHAHDSPAPGA